MTSRPKVLFVLYIVAALLALAAAIIQYAKTGNISVGLIGAVIFLLAFGLAMKTRAK